MKEYVYFVSYFFSNDSQGAGSGFGFCSIAMNTKIRTMDDIEEIKRKLEEEHDLFNVNILNWKELEG